MDFHCVPRNIITGWPFLKTIRVEILAATQSSAAKESSVSR